MSYGKNKDHQFSIFNFADDPKIADAIAPQARERTLKRFAR